jgi:hypothetical protein
MAAADEVPVDLAVKDADDTLDGLQETTSGTLPDQPLGGRP